MRSTFMAIAITCLVASVSSCERYIDLKNPGPERMLVLNAMLSSTDSVHQAYLFDSRKEKVVQLDSEALFRAYVNGLLADEQSGRLPCPVDFNARFKPGDVVRLELSSGGMHASSEVTVGEPVPLPPMDTTMTGEGRDQVTRFRIRVDDRKGEKNYYMLEAFYDVLYYVDWVADGVTYYTVGDTLQHWVTRHHIDVTRDPLLNRDFTIGDGDDAETFVNNPFNLFTDETFRDGSHTLDVSVGGFHREGDVRLVSSDYSYVIRTRHVFRLQTISREAYNYIDSYAIEMSDLSGYFFFEAGTYPQNVKGGLGFVTAFATSEYVL